jgi:hypothetical protein
MTTDELTQEQNRRNAQKAQAVVDRLLKRAATLADEIRNLALWTENFVESPRAISNLGSAMDHAEAVCECLMIEASPKAMKRWAAK